MSDIMFIDKDGKSVTHRSDIIPRVGEKVSIFNDVHLWHVTRVVVNYDTNASNGVFRDVDVIVTVSLF